MDDSAGEMQYNRIRSATQSSSTSSNSTSSTPPRLSLSHSQDPEAELRFGLLPPDYHYHDIDILSPYPRNRAGLWQRIKDSFTPYTFCSSTLISLLTIVLIVASFIGLTTWIVHRVFVTSSSSSSGSGSSSSGAPFNDYLLSPKWSFQSPPTTREYTFTITDGVSNPDGVYRPMLLINNGFPGPLIECNSGDTIKVHVRNRAENATSIHWHGLFQRGTPWMDGTVGVTQCPIASGVDFTYEFSTTGQSGTYWYHAHMGGQAADGVLGPFVIHSPEEKELQKIKYATDRVVMVQDHYYDLSAGLMRGYLGPDSDNAEPVPDNVLINGRGVRNCDEVAAMGRNLKCDNSTASIPQFVLEPNQAHRLRIINVGSLARFDISVDEHSFAVTEVDGTGVLPSYYDKLSISPAQRYSIVLSANHTTESAFWFRASMATASFADTKDTRVHSTKAVVRYAPKNIKDLTRIPFPKSLDNHTEKPDTDGMRVLTETALNLTPAIPIPAPAQPDDTLHLRANFMTGAWRLSRGFFNDSTWQTQVRSPSLSRFVEGYHEGNKSMTAALTTAAEEQGHGGINNITFSPANQLTYQTSGPKPLVIDILLSNFDDGAHPIHLHGHKFWVLATGKGYPSPDLQTTLASSGGLTNPLRRDTAVLPAFGWLLIRFVADNPGMWALHCHIMWHAEAGMVMQFLERADVLVREEGFMVPPQMNALCAKPGVDKGERVDDGVWVGDFGEKS